MKNERGNAVVIVLGVVALLATPFIIWALTVASSDTVGKGNAIINKNDAVNRVVKQEMFEAMYADIVADDDKVNTATDAYERNDSYTNEVNLNGVISNCQTSVQEYNAEARKYSSADFRAVDLPAQIDSQDPETDCKPDNK